MLGIVSESEFARELDKLNKRPSNPSLPSNTSRAPATPEVVIEEQEKPGRKTGDQNVPESLRKLIGETSLVDGRKEALELAKMLDVSPSSVSAYARGATSTSSYNTPNPILKSHLNKVRERVTRKAVGKLRGALNNITDDKLKTSDAKELASIAKDMSVVIKNMEPPVNMNESVNGNTPQFTIYAPTFVKEDHYETLVVNE